MNIERLLWSTVTLLVLMLLFGNQGFRNLIAQYEERAKIQKSLSALHQQNGRLSRELALIHQDASYNEYLVRKQLKYVKKDEVEYHFPRPVKDNS